MTDEAGLLQAILNAPDDATLRLVYADWLEERGDPRGEYLRCQCACAYLKPADPRLATLLQREEELRQQHPAVILPWQRRLLLARIKKLLEGQVHDLDGKGRNERRPSYTPQPCLTEQEITAWEAANGVSLPEEYRLFLLEIGNGGWMPGEYCDFEVEALGTSPENPALQEPFPITKERLRERCSQLAAARLDNPLNPYPHFLPELDDYRDNRETECQPPGCLAVASYPSSDRVSLVVTGELHGSVWCEVGGWRPEFSQQGEQLDFLSWFADVLLDLWKS